MTIFIGKNNIFDRSAYRLLHLVAKREEYCPELSGNTYIQYEGNLLGQYGGNEISEPPVIAFDSCAEEIIRNVFKDESAKVTVK